LADQIKDLQQIFSVLPILYSRPRIFACFDPYHNQGHQRKEATHGKANSVNGQISNSSRAVNSHFFWQNPCGIRAEWHLQQTNLLSFGFYIIKLKKKH